MSIEINLPAIGKRIEELRGRLSQSDFAEMLGVDRKTVGTWERGEQLPATKALISLWSEFAADPAWVLTGSGFAPTTSDDERELLAMFRSASLTGKAAAIGALQGAAGMGGRINQQINGPISGGVAGKNIIHKGRKKKDEAGIP